MRVNDVIKLLVLAAIWGASFIFIRVQAPVLGPIMTAELRVLITGIVLLGYFALIGFKSGWKEHWKHYSLIGIVNCALPFSLYAFAGMHIPASYSVVINSTTPLFTALFSALWLGQRFTIQKAFAMLTGALGVALVAKVGPADLDEYALASIAACLVASACYGMSVNYIKRFASDVPPLGFAGISQLVAAVALLPILPFSPVIDAAKIDMVIIMNVLALAIICSAVAFVMFYRLIADIGPLRTSTVTFLMPAFGMFWGNIFLDEPVTWPMIAGAVLIVAGTGAVMRNQRGS